jgi:hypothetical protein
MTILSTAQTNKKITSVFMTRFIFMFVLLVFTLPVNAGEGEGKVALIAAGGSGIEAMSLKDIRRLYLGLKSADNKSVRSPVLNIQSEELYDEFLKNIMRMTESSYKRKQVKAIFRKGKEKIREVTSLEELNQHLLKNKGDVSFIEVTSIESMENIEVVQILW